MGVSSTRGREEGKEQEEGGRRGGGLDTISAAVTLPLIVHRPYGQCSCKGMRPPHPLPDTIQPVPTTHLIPTTDTTTTTTTTTTTVTTTYNARRIGIPVTEHTHHIHFPDRGQAQWGSDLHTAHANQADLTTTLGGGKAQVECVIVARAVDRQIRGPVADFGEDLGDLVFWGGGIGRGEGCWLSTVA